MADRFDAFISYSRAADGDLAPALQAGLQRLAKPWAKRRALEVFRDETGLAVTPDLWGSITESLDAAEWFVLLASPQAAESRWVNQEIERRLELDPDGARRILPVLTSGSMVWDLDRNDWSDESDAVPPAIRGAYDHEPRYIDLTWVDASTDTTLANPRFKQAVAEIAAPMHGIGQDELIGEDVRRHRLATRLRRAAVTGLALLTAGAVVATVLALRAEDRAQSNAAEATTREYAAISTSLLVDDPELATLYAVEAVVGPDGTADDPTRRPEAERALRNALNQLLAVDSYRVGPTIDVRAVTIAVHPAGTELATLDADGVIARWSTATGESVGDSVPTDPVPSPPAAPFAPARELDYSPDGSMLLLSASRTSDDDRVIAIDVVTGSTSEIELASPAVWLDDRSIAGLSVDGSSIVRWREGDGLTTVLTTGIDTSTPNGEPRPMARSLDTLESGALTVVTGDERLVVVDPDGPNEVIDDVDLAELDHEGADIDLAIGADDRVHLVVTRAFSPDPAITGRPSWLLSTVELDDAAPVDRLNRPELDVGGPVADGAFEISPDGRLAADLDGERQAGLAGAISGVLEFGRHVDVTVLPERWGAPNTVRIPTNQAADLAWLPAGSVLAVASSAGVEFHAIALSGSIDQVDAMTVSADDRRVVSWAGFRGDVEVRDAGSDDPIVRFDADELEGEGDHTEPFQSVLGLGPGQDSVLASSLIVGSSPHRFSIDERLAVPTSSAIVAPFAVSASGTLLLDADGTLTDLVTGQNVRDRPFELPDDLVDLRWIGESEVIALIASGDVLAFDATSGDSTPIATGLVSVTSLGVDPTRGTVLVGDGRGRFVVIDRSSSETSPPVRAHRDAVGAIDVSTDGRHVVSAGGTVAIHAVASGDEVWSSDEVPAFDGRAFWLVAAMADGSVITAGTSGIETIVGPDVDLACGSVSAGALDRFRARSGRPSACLATGVAPAAPTESGGEPPPVVTTTPVDLGGTPVVEVDTEASTPSDEPIAVDAVDAALGRVPVTREEIAETCPRFVERVDLPLTTGDRGELIAAVQLLLIDAGSPSAVDDPAGGVAVDGCLGPTTTNWVSLFQLREGLPDSGAVDQATVDRLVVTAS